MGKILKYSSDKSLLGEGLRSDKSARRLELISGLRSRGVGSHVALPQLVVCGDQSAGKSSVLEGLTGIPFPRQEGLCTTFATEIILQHQLGETTVKASIIADQSRSAEEKDRLESYQEEQSLDKLADIIDTAGDLMGIRKPGKVSSGPSFVEDVLQIQVLGPHGIHLSVVDLPGLISVPNEDQTDKDVQTVHQLVNKYVADRRTIILAVVQASNDIANQAIIQKSKKVDTAGERTVGIITKPDLINRGTEVRIALLASKRDTTKLKLGFFLVKNPSPSERQEDSTSEERFKNETQYFQSSPWAEQGLDPERTGTPALRKYLQELLERHIEKELPVVRMEIKKCLRDTEEKLAEMGEERSEPAQMRSYLTRLAMLFQNLMTSGSNGTYVDSNAAFFGGPELKSRRLRAVIQKLNSQYSDDMMERGQKRTIVNDPSKITDSDEGNIKVSEEDMKKWIQSVYESSRGKELSGTYNYVLLAELFHEQASPWLPITEQHIESVDNVIRDFVNSALEHVVIDEQVIESLKDMVETQLEENLSGARKEIGKLWEDEQQQPITYNHYFTDKIQNSRQDGSEKLLRNAMINAKAEDDLSPQSEVKETSRLDSKTIDLDKLLSGLQRRINVDMNQQAYAEALIALNAYYMVARKVFVDNICRQVVERHLLRKLQRLFSPDLVAEMDEDELTRIAGENANLIQKRKKFKALKEELTASLAELRKLH